jgi:hypothetical protein
MYPLWSFDIDLPRTLRAITMKINNKMRKRETYLKPRRSQDGNVVVDGDIKFIHAASKKWIISSTREIL